ncbi:MAG: hypothetical protein WA323_10540 [Candidatus Nitrosopolaris sp.]
MSLPPSPPPPAQRRTDKEYGKCHCRSRNLYYRHITFYQNYAQTTKTRSVSVPIDSVKIDSPVGLVPAHEDTTDFFEAGIKGRGQANDQEKSLSYKL